MYEDLIKDTIKVMNEHELDYGLYLEFHDCNCIEFCMIDSDDEDDECGCCGQEFSKSGETADGGDGCKQCCPSDEEDKE